LGSAFSDYTKGLILRVRNDWAGIFIAVEGHFSLSNIVPNRDNWEEAMKLKITTS